MQKIKTATTVVNVPDSWSEITLADYQRWYIHPPQSHAEHLACMAGLCRTDAEVLQKLPRKDFEELVQTLQFTADRDLPPSRKIKIDGKEYFIISSDDLTLGEWVDVDAVLGDDENLTKLSDMLSIICRPAGEEYNHKTAKERAQLFRQQPCSKMIPLVSFFFHREQSFNEILTHSSAVEAAAARLLRGTKTFAANGDGIKRLPIWRRIRYCFLMRSLACLLSESSAFSSIR